MTVAPLHVVILAAGKGSRLHSDLPKVLHPVGGKPMLAHVIAQARALAPAALHLVIGHGADRVRAAFADVGDDVHWVVQHEQLGTGHAVAQALPAIPDAARVLVLCGDVPTAPAQALLPMLAARGLALLTAQLDDPSGYGRILRGSDGAVVGIVEHRDASPAQRAIGEINTGIVAAPASRLRDWVARLHCGNAGGEYYLTDVVALAVADGDAVTAVDAGDYRWFEGVNTRAQLAAAERRYQLAQADGLMAAGLGLADPARFDLRGTLSVGRDCWLDVGVIIEGEVKLGNEVRVGAYSVLRNVEVGDGVQIESHCVIDGAYIGAQATIGPFARLRPGAMLGQQVHIGNFVEIKKARLGDRSKAGHLAYLGDAQIGEDVNIGAGVITCNYDGVNKHSTVIGDRAFIGTDSQLVAPVRVGDDAYIAAGSTISRDAPAGALSICRAREQRVVPGWKRPQKSS